MSRLDRHARVSAALAAASSDALNALVGATSTVGVGGGSTTVEVAGARVFAKRVPLTDLELAHPHSTANLFDLPMTCNYGIGSPGFTAWRELAANTLVTESVLAGEAESFPLLHHWRILPGRAPIAPEYADVTAAAAVFGGSPSVRARLEALAAATHSLVLFTEHIPTPMADWLADSPRPRRSRWNANSWRPPRSSATATSCTWTPTSPTCA
ncbi:hypothetical protein ACFQV2_07675 [Actinokineospora soli]|uniref:Uncharacterized protein n=1 Tax=Actinokineospora soli TaxID=1048753 RepID=A0ABW2TIE9_9PSEU